MKSFERINTILGWLLAIVSSAVYIMTMEPTASFWDCGEFIAVSYKLMVPHPPGAPFFLLVGRLFSMMAGNDVTQVAYFVNMVSALTSGFCAMFLFWTVTLLARKIVLGQTPESEMSFNQAMTILLAGVVGGMAYTFSDSAWFSAVEAEVYAMSSLFTAIVIWAMLKWERRADEPGGDRWLLFIAYATGLSIGVHLLNLVTVPALAFIYYFRRYKPTTMGAVYAGLAGMAVVAIILSGIIPGLPTIAGKFEVLFVNSFGMPYNTGVITFVLLLVGSITYGIIRSDRQGNGLVNLLLLSLVFVLFGYISYGIILIRSNYGTPINENNPSNILSFVSYLKREQYGDRPLLYGPLYNARPTETKMTDPIYIQKDGKYVPVSYKMENVFDSKDKMLLPRIYSAQQNHIQAYQNWVKLPPDGKRPSFGTNLAFMFKYQIGYMYFRYFLWNFAGREADFQDADWLSPFDSDTGIPEMIRTNKARNNFFMLPLILGLAGLWFQIKKNGKNAFVVGLLWFFTGIAIVIYLNQPPVEPRERDYTFSGSFYAFCIWIGLGVLLIEDFLKKFAGNSSGIIAGAIGLVIPIQLAVVGWDDHSRADRYHSLDSAHNLLESCEKNAILFTGGDNDTFPLWYAQEVEGIRTDVRVCNLSLLGTDWYIDQMKKQAYQSTPLPISLDFESYANGVNDVVQVYEPENNPYANGIYLKDLMKMIKEKNPSVMYATGTKDPSGKMLEVATAPTPIVYINVDTAKVLASGQIPAKERVNIQGQIRWNIGRNAIYKNDLAMLDIIAHNEGFERPIYFSTTLGNSSYLNLKEYFQMEGLAYRFIPAYNRGANFGVVNTDRTYEILMKKCRWRNLDRSDLFYEENYKRFPLNARNSFYRLAEALVLEGKNDKAKEVIEFCFKKMPNKAIPYDPYTPQFVALCEKLGLNALAKDIDDVMYSRTSEEMKYAASLGGVRSGELQNGMFASQTLYYGYQQLFTETQNKAYETKAKRWYDLLTTYQNYMPQQAPPSEE